MYLYIVALLELNEHLVSVVSYYIYLFTMS